LDRQDGEECSSPFSFLPFANFTRSGFQSEGIGLDSEGRDSHTFYTLHEGYKPMDFSQLKRVSIHDRKSLVQSQSIPTPPAANSSFSDFWNALPDALKSRDLKALVRAIQQANALGKPVILMMGAHAIKVGLSHWIIQAVKRGHVQHIAFNGACLVHDFELALSGTTSEDVAESLEDGSFGMTRETGVTLNQWINEAADGDRGLGEYIGQKIAESDYPYQSLSLFGAVYQSGITTSVHVAVGTDVIHHHPEASGASIGQTSLADFHTFCEVVSTIGDGGVVINLGSAVILPEIFLKALTVARNVAGPISNFTTANFDMIQHYRPNENVVRRPTLHSGKGYSFTGHHEIMIPLLFMALFNSQ
jgi:hypothetical protein